MVAVTNIVLVVYGYKFLSVIGVCFFFFRKVKKGSLLIDSSTIDPAISKELAKEAEKMGAVFMDAPVSGGKFFFTKLACLPGKANISTSVVND